MKVRLKPGEFLKSFVPSLLFQFHEGPIKAERATDFSLQPARFQFHEGPIKAHHSRHRTQPRQRFNSMKVRLKPSAAIVSRLDFLFQFHEGPIKALLMLFHTMLINNVSIP